MESTDTQSSSDMMTSCHAMETCFALLALCEGNKWPVVFDASFEVSLNRRMTRMTRHRCVVVLTVVVFQYVTVRVARSFLSDKAQSSSGSNVILQEEDVLVTDPEHVAEVFNTYYASIAEYESMPDGLDNLTFDSAVKKETPKSRKYILNSWSSFWH